MLGEYLESEGYKVSQSEHGDGLEDLSEISLVLLDVTLSQPGKDGLSILRDIRSRSDVPIIMVTGKDEDVDKIVGLELGADDYVTKPFNMRELFVRVKNLLWRAYEANRENPAHKGAGGIAQKEVNLQLTARQLQVLKELVNGSSNQEISQTLHISESTVKAHVGAILQAFGVDNRMKVINEAMKRGLVQENT